MCVRARAYVCLCVFACVCVCKGEEEGCQFHIYEYTKTGSEPVY